MKSLRRGLSALFASFAARIIKTKAAEVTRTPVGSPVQQPAFRIHSPIWIGRPRPSRLVAWSGKYARIAVITRQLKRASARHHAHLRRHVAVA